jgi:hypothetical protein
MTQSNFALPTTQLGNVARVDQVYGNDATAYIGGLPFLTIGAAINAVIGSGSVSLPQYLNTTIWVLPGTYNVPNTGGNTAITPVGPTGVSGTIYPLIALPARTALRGISLQTCVIQCTGPTGTTALLQMGENCRVEDLNLTLGSSSHAGSNDLVGIYFGGSTTVTSKLRTSVVNVSNAAMSSSSSNNVYGIQFDGSGSLGVSTFSFNCIKGSTISVYGNGLGNKRGLILTNTNIVTTRDTNVFVAAPPTNAAFTGSYVGIEANDPSGSGSIQLRSTTVGAIGPTGSQTYVASDILQTTPTTIANPTYLASAGIQVGPGVDLVTKTAGGKGFSAYNYPTTLFYCVIGSLRASGIGTGGGYLWPGSVPSTNGGGQFVQYPDTTNPPAAYRTQQPFILTGIVVNVSTAPGGSPTASTTTVKIRRTPKNGTIGDVTGYTIVISGTTTESSYYNTSQTFGAGDLLHVQVSYTDGSSNNATTDLSVQLDCF